MYIHSIKSSFRVLCFFVSHFSILWVYLLVWNILLPDKYTEPYHRTTINAICVGMCLIYVYCAVKSQTKSKWNRLLCAISCKYQNDESKTRRHCEWAWLQLELTQHIAPHTCIKPIRFRSVVLCVFVTFRWRYSLVYRLCFSIPG